MAVHTDSVNHALQYLKDRQAHVSIFIRKAPAAEKGTDEENIETVEESECVANMITTVHFFTRYTVPSRSDLVVEGLDEHSKGALRQTFQDRQIKTYALLSILYALLHFLAWTPSHFPTHLEYNLWRGSTIAMLAAPASMALMAACLRLSRYLLSLLPASSPSPSEPSSPSLPTASLTISPSPSPASPRTRTRWKAALLRRTLVHAADAVAVAGCYLFFMMAMPACIAYPFARVYLLVESFAGLRSVDAAVYKTVEWTGFIPHAG